MSEVWLRNAARSCVVPWYFGGAFDLYRTGQLRQ
jgi:hypothetical protein